MTDEALIILVVAVVCALVAVAVVIQLLRRSYRRGGPPLDDPELLAPLAHRCGPGMHSEAGERIHTPAEPNKPATEVDRTRDPAPERGQTVLERSRHRNG